MWQTKSYPRPWQRRLVLIPRTCGFVISGGKKDLADMNKLRMGPKVITAPLQRGAGSQKEMKAMWEQTELGGRWSQAKERQLPLEAGRRKERVLSSTQAKECQLPLEAGRRKEWVLSSTSVRNHLYWQLEVNSGSYRSKTRQQGIPWWFRG